MMMTMMILGGSKLVRKSDNETKEYRFEKVEANYLDMLD